jgi:hypothetical protein
MSNYILRKGRSSIHDLKDGGAVDGYPGQYPGQIYFVNNITGASGNDGLSWETAIDQLQKAIEVSEAFRLANSPVQTRNIIYVQGTGTIYDRLTSLPNWTDVIGVGANPRGNDSGIVTVGSITGSYNGAVGSGSTTDMRGTNWYNIQFIAGSASYYAFKALTAFRSGFYNCTFGTHSTCAAGPLAGLYIVTGSGITIDNCSTVANKAACVNGLKIGADGGTSSGNFSQCQVINCNWHGSTNGVLNNAYLCDETIFKDNLIQGGTYGVSDTSTETTLAGNAFYVGNYVIGGTAGFNIASTTNAAYQCVGNFASDAGENKIYSLPYTGGTT